MLYIVCFQPERTLFDPSPMGFIKEINKLPTTHWMHHLDWVWLIRTGETAHELYKRLQPHLITTDRLLIMAVNANSAYAGWMPKDAWEWLGSKKETDYEQVAGTSDSDRARNQGV